MERLFQPNKRLGWEFGRSYPLQLTVKGNQVWTSLNGVLLLTVEDLDRPLSSGGIAVVCEERRIGTDEVYVKSEFGVGSDE